MKYATIWALGAMWQQVELALVRVEKEALSATGLLSALHEWFTSEGEHFTVKTEGGDLTRRQFLSVLTIAERVGKEMLTTLGGAQALLERRNELFAEITRKNDPTGVIREALDEANWILELAGTVPVILVFDSAEAKQLGPKPLEVLVDVLGRVLDFLGTPETDEGRELRAAIEAALERARLLAEGAKDRQWGRRRSKPKDVGGEPVIDPSKIAATGEEAPDIVVGGGEGEEGEEGEEPAQGGSEGEASGPEDEGGKGRRRRPKREE